MTLSSAAAMPRKPRAIILPKELDDVDRVTGYLAWRWGAQSRLPAGHPYANRAP